MRRVLRALPFDPVIIWLNLRDDVDWAAFIDLVFYEDVYACVKGQMHVQRVMQLNDMAFDWAAVSFCVDVAVYAWAMRLAYKPVVDGLLF